MGTKIGGEILPKEAVWWLREEIDLSAIESLSAAGESEVSSTASFSPFQAILVFLAHGTEDEKVDVRVGREAEACVAAVGAGVG